jgi:hypothetical protein
LSSEPASTCHPAGRHARASTFESFDHHWRSLYADAGNPSTSAATSSNVISNE